jgi:hypothetical protein
MAYTYKGRQVAFTITFWKINFQHSQKALLSTQAVCCMTNMLRHPPISIGAEDGSDCVSWPQAAILDTCCKHTITLAQSEVNITMYCTKLRVFSCPPVLIDSNFKVPYPGSSSKSEQVDMILLTRCNVRNLILNLRHRVT